MGDDAELVTDVLDQARRLDVGISSAPRAVGRRFPISQRAKDLVTRSRAGGNGGIEALPRPERRLSDMIYRALPG
ncbi:hypothetical protein GCM10010124_30970 [Pilimelia terevasa]|uniref:Uncharacterized protein n=1 Tax=Pilimelia terevasa TaxID=53372 RepID=A0A8J3BUD9_9ACTN|nr:hypothetical protein GCM10010124_30970 [Pilimelia terevasa]